MFKVALLQLLSSPTQNENLEKGIHYCRMAKKMGADLALFPEMWNTGYTFPQNINEINENAIDTDSPFVNKFKQAAKELDMAIAVTYLEKWDALPRNTVTIIDRFGKCVLTYAKVHTCDFDEKTEKNLTPGDDFYVTDLDTSAGNLKIGAMICYDREFPESARILMLKGAEIILVPNACPMEINRLTQLRARAFENMTGIATANYAYGQPDLSRSGAYPAPWGEKRVCTTECNSSEKTTYPAACGGVVDCNGHSSAFDGIAYAEIRPGVVESRDTLLVEAGESEGIYMATFPVEKIREYRKNEVHGNAYRKPAKYRLLISDEVKEPFFRNDARR